MKSLRVAYVNGRATVDFNTESSGLQALADRTVATLLNNKGSDRTFPLRGTSLQSRLASFGSSDPVAVQHEFNFACVSAIKFFRDETLSDDDSLASVSMVLTGSTGQIRQSSISITNRAGQTLGVTPSL